MNLFIRALLVLLVGFGLPLLIGDTGSYERPVAVLTFLGAVAIFLGPLATAGGYWSRFHYVNTGTPGCVWIALGIICWLAAIALLISA